MPKGKNPKRYLVIRTDGREVGFAGTRGDTKKLLEGIRPYRAESVVIKLTEPPTRQQQPVEWWGDWTVKRVESRVDA
jgi:hypothetical protein